jgi:23S rRNA pseudouridine2605 synthase
MTRDDPPKAATDVSKRQRIAKLMARAGLCSRRDAEAWILEGRVSVNGNVLSSPAIDVATDDRILVDGAPIPTAEKTRLFLFHKPRGLVTSDHDPEGRATVADFLRDHWPEGPRVVTIGRLDINTEGLLLLTNDGGLARVLELPQTGWVRRYRVRAKGMTDPATLEALAAGVTIDGVDYAGIEAKLDRVQGANCWLTMGLREGKNREVKRVLEHIGLEVNRLIRLSFGPFQLLDLPEGAVEEVRTRVLRDQLGENLAAQAGVDFGDHPGETPPPSEDRPARAVGKAGKRVADTGVRPSAGRPTREPTGPRTARRDARPRQDRGEAVDDRPSPIRERPLAGSRKHVSTLRSTRSEEMSGGPRKRREVSATQDRRDRTVKVERLVSTRPAANKTPTRRTRTSGLSASDTRDPNKRFQSSRPVDRKARSDTGSTRRHASDDLRRESDRPTQARRTNRDVAHAGRPGTDKATNRESKRDPRRGDGPETPRRHASPSALGKRERMSRSGAPRVREAAPRSDVGGRVARPPRDDDGRRSRSTPTEKKPYVASGERRADTAQRRPDRAGAAVGRRDPSTRERHPRAPNERPDRAKGPPPKSTAKGSATPRSAPRSAPRSSTFKPTDRKPGGRPMGAASRKPGPRKPPGGGAAPRGKPSRGPSKPKR